MAVSSRKKTRRTGNRLLNTLPPAELKLLAGHFEVVHLSSRQVLFQADDPLEYLFFPVNAVLSLTVSPTHKNGHGFEIASVGNEGMVGFTALLGVANSFYDVGCLLSGDCLRISAPTMAQAMARRSAVDTMVKKYLAVADRTIIQSIVCNALHQVDQRVCRWLLAMHEKAAGEFPVTQDVLAARLGVRRPTVSLVANSLLKDGLISYHRGAVRVIDQARLEQAACDCFNIAKAVYTQIIEG